MCLGAAGISMLTLFGLECFLHAMAVHERTHEPPESAHFVNFISFTCSSSGGNKSLIVKCFCLFHVPVIIFFQRKLFFLHAPTASFQVDKL